MNRRLTSESKRASCWLPAILAFIAAPAMARAQQFTIGAYHLKGSVRSSLTQYDYTYTADVINQGGTANSLTGTVASSSGNTLVIKGSTNFGTVPANGTATSADTFVIRQDRRFPFEPSSLSWTFPPAVTQIQCMSVPGLDQAPDINQALASLPSGGILQLSAGTCYVGSRLHGFVSGTAGLPTILTGAMAEGPNAPATGGTMLQAFNNGVGPYPFDVVQLGETAVPPTLPTGVSYVTVQNLIIDEGIVTGPTGQPVVSCVGSAPPADTAPDGSGVGHGIYILVSDHNNVLANTIMHTLGDSIGLMGSSYNTVANNLVNYSQTNGIFLQAKTGCQPGTVSYVNQYNQILNNTVMNPSQYLEAGNGQVKAGQQAWDGIDLERVSYTTVKGNTVYGDDILLHCDQAAYCYGNIVDHNTIIGSTNVGIDVSNSQADFTITNNTITGTSWGGIDVNGHIAVLKNPNNLIQNNTLINTSHGDSRADGLGFPPGVPPGNATSCSGIDVKSTGQTLNPGVPSNLIISGNSISTAYTDLTVSPSYAGVCIRAAVNATVQVIDNVFPNRTGDGNAAIYAVPSAHPTISGNTDGTP